MQCYKGIQTKLEQIGNYGCYFLSICCQANYQGNIIELYDFCVEKGWMESDCTVLNPGKIYWYLTGTEVWVVKTTEEPKGDELFYVELWHNERTGYSHFKLPDVDTLKNSVTVREGKIHSYRIFYKA